MPLFPFGVGITASSLLSFARWGKIFPMQKQLGRPKTGRSNCSGEMLAQLLQTHLIIAAGGEGGVHVHGHKAGAVVGLHLAD